MKLLYCGQLWEGSTALQRARAFSRRAGIKVLYLDVTSGVRDPSPSLMERVRWKAGWPADVLSENERLIEMVRRERPDVVFVDNSKVISLSTLRLLVSQGVLPVYYSPDDMVAPHNLKYPFRRTLSNWAIIFTTKPVNVRELEALGAPEVVLVGNSFDADVHRPLNPAERDQSFETVDAVFIGAFEKRRCRQINALSAAGIRVAVYAASSGMVTTAWRRMLHHDVILKSGVYGRDYRVGLHHGKLALCFLREMNRDVITTRSIEIPATGRPMVAEKTAAHDEHFVDGNEYVGFAGCGELIEAVQQLLNDTNRRLQIAEAGRLRCLSSGYSTDHRARELLWRIEHELRAFAAPAINAARSFASGDD
ncbi:MAG: glycosyltransferase [Pseudomonadota bacterium]